MKKALLLLVPILCLAILLSGFPHLTANAEDWGALIGSLSDLASLIDEEEKPSDEDADSSEAAGFTGPMIEVSVAGQTLMVHQELVDALEKYEAFFDEYMDVIVNPDDVSLTRYAEILSNYTTYMDALDKINDYDLSDDESIYFLDVQNRINMKLLIASK